MGKHRIPLLPAALLAFALLAGCAPHATRVRLEAVAGEVPLAPATYAIRHGQPDAPPSAHENHRQRRALARALDALGFSEAAAPDGCDVLVWLHFGMVGEETPHQGANLEHLFVLDLRAVDAADLRAGRPERRLWRATASAHAHLDQREQVFQALLSAMTPRLGQTGEWDLLVLRHPVTGASASRTAP